MSIGDLIQEVGAFKKWARAPLVHLRSVGLAINAVLHKYVRYKSVVMTSCDYGWSADFAVQDLDLLNL